MFNIANKIVRRSSTRYKWRKSYGSEEFLFLGDELWNKFNLQKYFERGEIKRSSKRDVEKEREKVEDSESERVLCA